jgi:hypothetical protein
MKRFFTRWMGLAWPVMTLLALGCPRPSTTGDSSSSGGGSTSSSSSSGAPGTGAVGDGCDATHPCGMFKGSALSCVAGTCALPGCTTGSLGCPCNAGQCETPTTCQAEVCAAPGCTAGQAGCVCAQDMCAVGTECLAGFCRYPTRLSVRVDDLGVRACDVLLEERGRQVQSVAFGANVLGEHVRRGSRWALSFTRQTDEGGQGAVATLEYGGMLAVTPQVVTVVQSRCFDARGQAVASPGLSVR